MDSTILIAVLSFCGTLVGTFGGIVTSAKLTNYRIEQLEKKVEAHNNFATRIPLLEEKIKVEEHRIADLENYHK
jgi:hypothetical protein